MVKVKADKLQDFVRDIFHKAVCSETEGVRLGESLV